MVEGFAFPTVVSPFGSSKSLTLFGTGIIDQEIHFLQIKHTASAVYVDPEISSHLQAWKGKKTSDLLEEDSGFFQSFCEAPVEKFMKVVIIKEVKGSQYMGLLQSPVRDRLAALDKYEEEEEEALEKLLAFFQTKSWFSQGTSIFFHFPSPSKMQVSVSEDGNLPAAAEYVVENANVVYGILEYLAGERCQSPSLLKSMAQVVEGSESVMVEGFAFPTVISPFGSSKSLTLFGTGIIDQVIHFLQIKHTASAVYVDPEIVSHLQAWKGKKNSDLLEEESGFFQSFCEAPVEKFMKVVIIKEVKGSQYMGLLQSPVRDRLAALDKYEEEEEEALEKLLTFFQTKSWFSQGTSIFFHFSSPSKLQISVSEDGNLPAAVEYVVENANVVYGILEYLAGERCQSPSLLKSMAEGFSTLARNKYNV